LPVEPRGSGAVERDEMHSMVTQQQGTDVMRPRRGGVDRRIRTAAARGLGQHVPHAHPGGFERARALRVRQGRWCAEQRAHDRPEQIARMGVVLAGA